MRNQSSPAAPIEDVLRASDVGRRVEYSAGQHRAVPSLVPQTLNRARRRTEQSGSRSQATLPAAQSSGATADELNGRRVRAGAGCSARSRSAAIALQRLIVER